MLHEFVYLWLVINIRPNPISMRHSYRNDLIVRPISYSSNVTSLNTSLWHNTILALVLHGVCVSQCPESLKDNPCFNRLCCNPYLHQKRRRNSTLVCPSTDDRFAPPFVDFAYRWARCENSCLSGLSQRHLTEKILRHRRVQTSKRRRRRWTQTT